jgi:hypothetical protein
VAVEAWFPKTSKARMIREAHEHADLYGIEIGQDRSVSDDACAVVNWLRHEHIYRHNEKWQYAAAITKIGRSKVTVAYQVKTGKGRARSATVHAALVTPLETAV